MSWLWPTQRSTNEASIAADVATVIAACSPRSASRPATEAMTAPATPTSPNSPIVPDR